MILTRMRMRAARVVSCAALAVLLASAAALAQPQPKGTDIRTFSTQPDEREIDAREALDRANEIDLKLSKQIQLLQRQVNELERRLDELRAESGR